MTPAIRNHGETRLKPATLLHENLPKHESCAARSNYFSHFSNGNGYGNRKWLQPDCQRREHRENTRLNPTVRMETTPRHTQTKTINPLQQPEGGQARII